jgi:hypothetical protein
LYQIALKYSRRYLLRTLANIAIDALVSAVSVERRAGHVHRRSDKDESIYLDVYLVAKGKPLNDVKLRKELSRRNIGRRLRQLMHSSPLMLAVYYSDDAESSCPPLSRCYKLQVVRWSRSILVLFQHWSILLKREKLLLNPAYDQLKSYTKCICPDSGRITEVSRRAVYSAFCKCIVRAS